MLKIYKVAKNKAMKFNEDEWQSVNDSHFGKGVRWNTAPFNYKATKNGKLVGLIFGKHESGTIYVANIIVAKKHRRKGVGQALIQKAEEFGKKFGDHKIWLISGKNYPEDKFFKAVGFKKEAILPNLYFHKDFIIYSKKIK